MAYANLSQLCLNQDDADGTRAWGRKAVDLAEELDDAEVLVYALANIGSIDYLERAPAGSEDLQRSLAIAKSEDLQEHVGRAYACLVWAACRHRLYGLADAYIAAGLDYCRERDLDIWLHYLIAFRARSELDQGRWDEAVADAEVVLRARATGLLGRIWSLVVLGLVQVRRGETTPDSPLDQARALADTTMMLQSEVIVAAARAEAAWLHGDIAGVEAATGNALARALERGDPWLAGELVYWRWRAGVEPVAAITAAEPYAAQVAADWAGAAELWDAIGCPYEAALARADSPEEQVVRRALDELNRLGANPAAAFVARRLRERGARVLPRGPRAATRQNPANLTPRELEVLQLLAEGISNATIAARLFLSTRTVEHHVGAILRKLEVGTRDEAVARAAQLGIIAQDP
jgi:DNA-binding NarL/FixJ family response regulator